MHRFLGDSSLNLSIAYIYVMYLCKVSNWQISPIKKRTFPSPLKVALYSFAVNPEIHQPPLPATVAASVMIFIYHGLFSLFWNFT